MKILVTGGAGFLGHHFVEHLLKNTDWEIVVIDALTYASPSWHRLLDIKGWEDTEDRVRLYQADVSFYPFPPHVYNDLLDVNLIAHLAAETHVDRSISEPWSFVYSNVCGTVATLELAKKCKNLERFLYFSTDEVFGPAAQNNLHAQYAGHTCSQYHEYREWDRFYPTNPYSATKAAGEDLCLAWGNTYGVPVVISHCMNLFGERQHPEKFLPGTIRKILNGEKVIIHADPTRTIPGSRFWLHARNAASATLFLLTNRNIELQDKYNIAGQQELNNLEIAQRISLIMGREFTYEMTDFHSSRPGHDLRYALDGSKLASLGWTPPVELDASLEKTVNWYLAHPGWLNESRRN